MAVRIQLRRTKGWRLPSNTISVARPTKWGNPFKIGATVHFGPSFSGRDECIEDAEHACRLYRRWLFNLRSATHLVAPLRGKNLACWCRLDQPCHADVLLELANTGLGALGELTHHPRSDGAEAERVGAGNIHNGGIGRA
jgi:hypothetical protein